jgi:hypothetical protein
MSSEHPPPNYHVVGCKESMDATGRLAHYATVDRAESEPIFRANSVYAARTLRHHFSRPRPMAAVRGSSSARAVCSRSAHTLMRPRCTASTNASLLETFLLLALLTDTERIGKFVSDRTSWLVSSCACRLTNR